MTVPDYQTLMMPVLQAAANGDEIRVRELVAGITEQFNLSPEDRAAELPSGGSLIYSRVWWAKTYLQSAGLIQSTRRGHFRITDRGLQVLAEAPARLNNSYLRRFEEFRHFVGGGKQTESTLAVTPTAEASDVTPDEVLRRTLLQLEGVLAKELLDRLLSASPTFFERAVVALLLAMGYGGSREEAGRAIGKSGDGGLDGVIDQDRLGLDRVYVQAKRYALTSGVDEPTVRGFSGSLGAAKADKGVFVTTSYFTSPAIEFAKRHPAKIVLIDGQRLTQLMIQFGVGVQTEQTLPLRKIDEDFFDDE